MFNTSRYYSCLATALTQQVGIIHNTWYNKVYSCVFYLYVLPKKATRKGGLRKHQKEIE